MCCLSKTSAGKKAAKTKALKYTIDCSQPRVDGVMAVDEFQQFMHERIKVNGKTGQLGDSIGLSADREKLFVTTNIPFSKRYLKYLTKKFLKKMRLRDYLRVVATNKHTYAMRYYKINAADAGGE